MFILEGKTRKKVVEKKFINIPKKSMTFEESPNSLRESCFPGELRLGES